MTTTSASGFTVYAHVFYTAVWEDIARDLAAIRQPFDLIITRPYGSHAVVRPRSSYLRSVVEMEVENRGRDILPFLTSLSRIPRPADEIGLKLHTKQSPHRGDGADWRRYLIRSLLEMDDNSRLVGPRLLAHEQRIGLVAPAAHLLPVAGRISTNEEVMLRIVRRLTGSIAGSAVAHGRFPAGSMFWFRRAALESVAASDFTDLFIPERGQLDGTAAHAFERLFAFIVEQQNFLSTGMETAESILQGKTSQLSPDELSQLIEDSLLTENPFALPIALVWRRYPALLKLAHELYARAPKSAIRTFRRSFRR